MTFSLPGNEGQCAQLLYLPFVNAGLERKVKVLQALAVRQPGQLQPGFPALPLALLLFRRKQFIEKLHISLLCVEGLPPTEHPEVEPQSAAPFVPEGLWHVPSSTMCRSS